MILPCKDIICEHCFLDLQEEAKLTCPKCLKRIPKEFDGRMTKGKMRYCIPLLSTLFRTMEFSLKLHIIKVGWSIVYFEGLQVIILKGQTLMKCRIMRHFILVFTVCLSTC